MDSAATALNLKLEDFEISEDLGFLLRDPLEFLPPYFEPWNSLAKEVPDLLAKEKLREKVRELPVLDHTRLSSYKEKRLAHVLLGVISSAYVWQYGRQKLPEYLPASVAVPMWALSNELDLPPGLTFASMFLAGWQQVDKNGGLEFENIRCMYSPSANQEALDFVTKMLRIEVDFAPGVKAIVEGVKSIALEDDEGYINALGQISASLRQMMITLKSLKDVCSPDGFFLILAPFFSGYGDPGSPLKDGLVFEGVSKEPIKFPHATGAQTSTIPAVDEFLGVKVNEEAGGLKKITYNSMLPAHRRFLETLRSLPSAISYAKQSSNEAVKSACNDLVNTLAAFRSLHIQMVTRYAIIPLNKLLKAANLPKEGGPPIGLLKEIRNEVQDHKCPI